MLQQFAYRAYDPSPVENFIECGISVEGLADTIASVKDVVGHAFRTVKVNIVNIRKDYVQSDFQQYHSANRAKINLFLKNPSRKLVPDTFLPMPDGMLGTYPAVTAALVPYVMLPYGETTKKTHDCVKGLIEIINATYPKEADRVDAIKSKIDSYQFTDVLKMTEELKTKLPKLFAKGRVTSSTVREQFKDKKEVAQIVDSLVAAGDRYKEFIKHQSDIRTVEKEFTNLVNAAQNRDRHLKPNERKEFANSLYQFVKNMAIFNDYYGIALNELLRIENKFMLCMTQMMEAAK